MPATNEPRQREVRVFISSTFRDMHAERDHLVTVVFPELRERVEKLGLDFFDVDLRWGVPAKNADGEKANSWEYCRQWIDRIEPFFVCILGQRYGWVPAARDFKSYEDKVRQEWEPRSITDLEVRHAVLDDGKKRRSYFYLRETEAPTTATEYVDPAPLSAKLEQLKKDVRSCGRPVRDYPCKWTGSEFTGMDDFGRQVLDDLWSGVLRDERYVSKDVWRRVLGTDPDADPCYVDESEPVPREIWEKIISLATPEPKEPLDAERMQMEAFASARLRWFQGRTGELEKLEAFVSSTAENAPRLAVISALPGQGKSALIAKLSTLISDPSKVLITHFVGATERSSSARAVVERLLGELDRSGVVWPTDRQESGEDAKRDFNSLCFRLALRLGDYAGDRHIVILLDALNQLSDGLDLRWLPARLGSSVRMIVSCVGDAAARADSPEQRVLLALASRQLEPVRVPLGPLTDTDVRTIVIAYLKEYCHELDREHLDTLCAMAQARNPLYLLVMLNELRTLGGNDVNRIVPARIAAMSRDCPDTVSLFRWVLQRLEVFGPEAVKWWCLYLAHGRAGMASEELSDLLTRKLGFDATAIALRIERGLRRYLLRRGKQLDFFHGELGQALMEQYALDTDPTIIHSEIAEHFDQQTWFVSSVDSHRAPNQRKCEELLHHRLLAGSPQLVRDLLFSFELNEGKIAAGMIYDLIDEYAHAYSALPKQATDTALMVVLRQAIQWDAEFLQKHMGHYPQVLLQSCYNSLGHLCSQGDTSFVDGANSSRLKELLESWRATLDSLYPHSRWLRSRIAPLISPGTRLQTVCQQDRSNNAELIFSSDNAQLISVSDRLSIRTFRADTGKQVSHVEDAGAIRAITMAISPDGKHIAGVCDGSLRLWLAETAGELFRVKAPDSPVTDLAFSPDGLVIAGCARDGTIRIWGARTGKELRCLQGNYRAVQSLAFSSADSLLVTASDDGTIRLWDATKRSRQLRCFRLPHDHHVWRRCVCFAPSDRTVIVIGTSYSVILLDSKTGRSHSYPIGHKTISSFSQAMSADGSRIVHRGPCGLQVLDLRQGKTILSFNSPFLVGDAVAISPNGRLLATGIFDGIGLWDLDVDAPCQTVANERYQNGIKDISTYGTSGTGDLKVVSASADGSLCIWRYSAPFMKLIRKFTHETDSEGIKFVTFSPDGSLFGVINSSMRYTLNTMSLYDSRTNSLHAKVIEHSDGIYSDVLSGTFFKRFPSAWALSQGSQIEMEDLRRLQNGPGAGGTQEMAVVDLRRATGGEQESRQSEATNNAINAENGELLIQDKASGAFVACYAAGLSSVQSIPIPDTWAASSRAGLEVLSLESSSAKLW